MLNSSTDLAYLILQELLGMHKLWLVFIVFISRAENIIGTHAPGIDLITRFTECIVVMAHGSHFRYSLTIERLNGVGYRKVVDVDKVWFFVFLTLFGRLSASTTSFWLFGVFLFFLLSILCFILNSFSCCFIFLSFASCFLSCLSSKTLLLFKLLSFKFSLLPTILPKEITNTTFTFVITTPAIDAPTFSESYRMVLAASYFHRLLLLSMHPQYSSWCAHVLLMANTKLTMVVETPCEEHTLVITVEGCVTSAPNILCLFGANLFNFS